MLATSLESIRNTPATINDVARIAGVSKKTVSRVINTPNLVAEETAAKVQKAIGELLLCDYSRRGFFDGVGIRLPTITVRPGRPNARCAIAKRVTESIMHNTFLP